MARALAFRPVAIGILAFALSRSASGAEPEPTCSEGSPSTACMEAALARRGSGDVSLMQHKGALSVTSAAFTDAAAIAAHMREQRTAPGYAAAALKLGLEAFDEAAAKWMASPPLVEEGIEILASKLLQAVKMLLPPEVRGTAAFAEFQREWMHNFERLPSLVQSVDEDIKAFAQSGDTERLVRAINTMLIEAGSVVSRLLPEELGDEVAKFLGAMVDIIDGMGDGLQDLDEGATPSAVESIYNGLRAAAEDLVPPEYLNDDTYKAMVGVLDGTLGSVSKNVLKYKQQMEQSTVCWKGIVKRDRQRPSLCEDDYTWDGEQWCLSKQAAKRTAKGADLLEHSVSAKRPKGALPARCQGSAEKRGGWCYQSCPAGYEPHAARCRAVCGAPFPSSSELMCGKYPGAIKQATMRMMTETARNAVTVGSIVSGMGGMAGAGDMKDTMQTLVDMGLPFAHPKCPPMGGERAPPLAA